MFEIIVNGFILRGNVDNIVELGNVPAAQVLTYIDGLPGCQFTKYAVHLEHGFLIHDNEEIHAMGTLKQEQE